MFASTEQNKEKNRFPRRASTDRNNNSRYLDISYSCYAIRVFLTDFIEVFLCKSISANVKDLLTVLCNQYISGVQSGTA